MAKRFTDTEIWDKEWFMKLTPKLKCLVKLVRDKCDLSGVWSPNWTLANNYVGESVSEEDLLKIDNGEQFFKMPGGKIFCLGFIQFQYGELSEKSPVHRKIINLLATHKIDHKHPINRVEEKEEEVEEETVMEEVPEEEKVGEDFIKKLDKKIYGDFNFEFVNVWYSVAFFRFLNYRHRIKKPFKNQMTVEACYKNLVNLSKKNWQVAEEIVQQSIANQWQGLFELNTTKKENGKQQTVSKVDGYKQAANNIFARRGVNPIDHIEQPNGI